MGGRENDFLHRDRLLVSCGAIQYASYSQKGKLLLILLVYESFANLREPLIPMHFFKDRGYVAAMISLSLGASVYYSQAIIWPDMAANVYGQGRAMWAGWVATLVGLGITIGEMIGGSLAKLLGWTKYQCLTVISLGTLFLGCKSYVLHS